MIYIYIFIYTFTCMYMLLNKMWKKDKGPIRSVMK